MISKEYLDPIFAANGPVTESMPVVYALFKLGEAQKSPARYALQLELTRSKMAPFARANGEQQEFFISAGKETATLQEFASQLSPEQLEVWLSEVPGMLDAARNPKAPGAAGQVLGAMVGAIKLAGGGNWAMKTMLTTSALRWRDDRLNHHRVNVSMPGEDPFAGFPEAEKRKPKSKM